MVLMIVRIKLKLQVFDECITCLTCNVSGKDNKFQSKYSSKKLGENYSDMEFFAALCLSLTSTSLCLITTQVGIKCEHSAMGRICKEPNCGSIGG